MAMGSKLGAAGGRGKRNTWGDYPDLVINEWGRWNAREVSKDISKFYAWSFGIIMLMSTELGKFGVGEEEFHFICIYTLSLGWQQVIHKVNKDQPVEMQHWEKESQAETIDLVVKDC